jgi:transketolase
VKRMIKILENVQEDPQEMRKSYCEALIAAAGENEKLIVLDCDLSSSVGTKKFYEIYPERAINCGIEEENACGVAAGLSVTGFVPFLHSFAVFTTRRMCDQVFLSCAYAGQNVKLIGGDAGVSAGFNGGTHMAFEDIGIMRSIPEVSIIEPTDGIMMRNLIPKIAARYGVDYIRMPRKTVQKVYEDGSDFTIGEAVLAREGRDVSIIASGIMVAEALQAAKELEKDGVSAEVIDMFTIKPLDKAAVICSAGKTGAVVTAENHNIIGGLGSAVAEVLGENKPVPVERVGIMDQFGVVGTQEYLMRHFGITSRQIVEKAKKAIARKLN